MADRRIYPVRAPRLLDLFCGAGAVSVGYAEVGWELVGVDIKKQPNYPFEFRRMDAMKVVQSETLIEWLDVDIIHASPPCQSYSFPTRHLAYEQPRLVDPLRECLEHLINVELIKGYVIENVVDAPLLKDKSIMLCGTMFGKRVYRHRKFESNLPLVGAGFPCDHSVPAIDTFGGGRWYESGDGSPVMHKWIEEMFDGRAGKPGHPLVSEGGLSWCLTQEEAKQAVPCCYTEYIGLQLQNQL
jgi:DNA (cytosine-5)-methyltransferase 1